MAAIVQFPFLFGVPMLPARRVVAIDPGATTVKVVLAELFLGRIRFIQRSSFEFPENAGKAAIDQARQKLHDAIKSIGEYPLAIVLPQHAAVSQVVNMPTVGVAALERLIQAETMKLAGLSQSRLAYDYSRLTPFGKHNNAFWLTLCQENEITNLLDKLALNRTDVCDITTAGNALRASYLRVYPDTELTLLADLGYRSTSVSVLREGQCVYSGSFALGTEMFIETVAAARSVTMAEADALLRGQNLFFGPEAVPDLLAVVANWRQEILRVVDEWFIENPDPHHTKDAFQYVLGGGGSAYPGLLDHLNRQHGSALFTAWPARHGAPTDEPSGFYAVAEGTAILALGKTAQSASLLPQDLKNLWKGLRAAQRTQSASFLLLLVLMALLAVGTWQKLQLAEQKTALQRKATEALEVAGQIDLMKQVVAFEYERVRPVLERRKQTLNSLQALTMMQQVRSNRNLWFVLLADDQSYFSAPLASATNEPPATNILMGPMPLTQGPNLAPSGISMSASVNGSVGATNRIAIRPGFVVEVVIPEEGDALRRTLSQLVTSLKQYPGFRNVDTIPPEQRHQLANPKVVIPDKHFAIAMELVENEFARPTPQPKTTNTLPVKTGSPIFGPAFPLGISMPGTREGKR